MRARLVGLILVALGAISFDARGADKAAARDAYEQGTKYYDLNQYAEALEAFKRAYWEYEDPAFLFNIAQCHRALGNKADALRFYRSYLRKSADTANRADVEKIIADLESALANDKPAPAPPPVASVAAAPVAPPSAIVPAATAVAAAAPEKAKRSVWKRAWFWGVMAGVVGAGVAIGVGAGVGARPHPPRASDGAVQF
jgi:tetratricopeptide (TPR) repeat protein